MVLLEVRPEVVTILAQSAETAEHIDVNRALKAKERAEARIQEENKVILISNVLNLRFNVRLTESLCQKENKDYQFETPLFVILTKRGVFFVFKK